MPRMTFGLIRILSCQLFFYSAGAQSSGDTLIGLKGTLEVSEQRYHLLKAGNYEVSEAANQIEVTKYQKLPTIDASYQAGVGTANSLTGIFYPSGILPMTGPPSSSNIYTPVTGSAASILLNWQALSFGQRNAEIDVSKAMADSKKTEWEQIVFQYKINIISAYLDLLFAYDVVSIHKHNIERVQADLYQSRVLAKTGIRPGVDTALFLSEFSKARIDLLNAQKQLQILQLQLGQWLVTNLLPVPIDTGFIKYLPIGLTAADHSIENTPTIRSGQSQLALSLSQESFLKKSWLPKLNIWGTGFARGSGFQENGEIKQWDGMQLTRVNYGAGFQLIFPIMKYGETKRALQQQSFLSKAAQERLEESRQAMITQSHIADLTFQNSISVVAETEQQLKSGLYAFNSMQIRYNTGLVNFADLIQAQYSLLRSELDLKKSYWDAWKALLLQAAVHGDENIFIQEIK